VVLNPKSTVRDAVKAVATLVIGLAVLGLFVVLLGGHRFWEKLDAYVITFSSVRDLTPGRPVKFAGLEIGRVQKIAIDPDDPSRVKVVIGVNHDFVLYDGTYATISQKGLVGDNYIMLDLEAPVGPVLVPGSAIPERVSLSVNDVAQRLGLLIDTVGPKFSRAADGLEAMLSAKNVAAVEALLAEAAGLVAETRLSVSQVRTDVSALATSARTNLDSGGVAVRDMGRQAAATLQRADALMAGLNEELTRTLSAFRQDTGAALGGVTSLTTALETDWGYDQVRLAEVLENLNRLINDLRGVAQALKDRPWRVLYPPEGGATP